MHDLRFGPDNNVEERVHNEVKEDILERIKNGDFKSIRSSSITEWKTDKMKKVEKRFCPRYGRNIKDVVEYFYVSCGLTIPNVSPIIGVSETTLWKWLKEFGVPIHNNSVTSKVKESQDAINRERIERLKETGRTKKDNPHLCGLPEPIKQFCGKCAIKECAYYEES